MENKIDCYRLFSLYHDEYYEDTVFGFTKLKNGKDIIWINNKIYLLKDFLEEEKELVEFDSNISSINIIDDFTFFIKTKNEDSLIIYFNNDYSINKQNNLFKAELLLILDSFTFVVLDKNNNDMQKLIIMKKDEGKYRHFMHIIDKFETSENLFYKTCQLTNKKFLFCKDEKGDIYYYIYSYEFQKRKFKINQNEYYEEKRSELISIVPISEKYIIKFLYLKELILELFDIELFQKIYLYHTNVELHNHHDNYYIHKMSFNICNDINEIPQYHLIKFLQLEKFENFEKKSKK